MTAGQLHAVHAAMESRLRQGGAVVDRIYTCTSVSKCPVRKPAPGLLRQALQDYGANPTETPFIGDQIDDMQAAFHAGCRRVLVRAGLGRKTLANKLPDYVMPFDVYDDIADAVSGLLGY